MYRIKLKNKSMQMKKKCEKMKSMENNKNLKTQTSNTIIKYT